MPASPIILGSSTLASPGMLLWALAALVPLIIHLWSRRRYQKVPWAAMQQLLAAIRTHSRRWRIEQWALLCVRTLILLLVPLAWADPVWSPRSSRSGISSSLVPTHYILVLDASYSMACRTGDRTRLEEARARALELVRASRQGDGFTLVLLAQPPQIVIGEPVFDPEVVQDELNSAEVLHTGGDLNATLVELELLLDQALRSSPRLERHRVAFFTDLCRTTWGAVQLDETQRRIVRLAERADLLLVDVGGGEVANAAVTRIELREPLVIAGRDLSLEVDVQSFATREMARRKLELSLDGQPVGTREIDIPAGGRVTASFSPRFETPGDHTLEVQMTDDDLEIDNVRWLAVAVRERIRVLCVEGKPGEARFLALALEPTSGVGSRIETTVADESALAEMDLSSFDVVCLCNVGRFDPNEAAALRRFVQAGGGLAVFLGDLVQAENYHQWLGPSARGPAILPAQLGSVLPDTGLGLDPLGYRHPLAAPFRGQPQAGLLTTPVWRSFELTVYDSDTSRIAIALASGRPFAIEGRSGAGRCLLFATSASAESVDRTTQPPTPWTALPAWPSFVPLVQESLQLLVRSGLAARNVEVGQPLKGLATDRSHGGSIELTGPVSSRGAAAVTTRVSLIDEPNVRRWTYQPPLKSGLYEARSPEAGGASQWFAVNVTTDESDLSRLDADLLPAALGRSGEWDSIEAGGIARLARRPWFRYLLVAVAGCLLVETGMAWRLGTRTAR